MIEFRKREEVCLHLVMVGVCVLEGCIAAK